MAAVIDPLEQDQNSKSREEHNGFFEGVKSIRPAEWKFINDAYMILMITSADPE